MPDMIREAVMDLSKSLQKNSCRRHLITKWSITSVVKSMAEEKATAIPKNSLEIAIEIPWGSGDIPSGSDKPSLSH